MIASSRSTDPASVKRKNLIAAYSFRGPPQIPIRKYIGKSITSQKTKKRNMSSAAKVPDIPVWSSSSIVMYPGTLTSEKCGCAGSRCSSLPDHQGIDAIVATNEIKVDRITIDTLIPSTPTKYSM